MQQYGEDISVSMQKLTSENRKYVENFVCGNGSIDGYYREDAVDDDTTVTYMFIDDDADCLIACITIACSAIFVEADEREYTTVLSAMEVKYFATNENYQHLKYSPQEKWSLSQYLFIFMLHYMKQISQETIGAAKIVLYSVPTAVNFYKRCKFKEFGDSMRGDEGYYVDGCVPLYFNLNS